MMESCMTRACRIQQASCLHMALVHRAKNERCLGHDYVSECLEHNNCTSSMSLRTPQCFEAIALAAPAEQCPALEAWKEVT